MHKSLTIALSLALLLSALAVAAQEKQRKQYPAPPEMKIDPNKKYTATIDTSAGTMTAELYPNVAPQTVNAFVFLAREGFYEGVIFQWKML